VSLPRTAAWQCEMALVDCACRVLVTSLPAEARGPVCRIRWWQPVHSGLPDRDVWALDDVTVADSIHNMFWVDFSELTGSAAEQQQQPVDAHRGKIASHCGRPAVLV